MTRFRHYFIFLLLALFVTCGNATNVLFIVADDLGYNDISWHNPDIISPNLDKLAKDGIILESHYVLHVCTPTRASLMTGYYPIHTGRQHSYIHSQEPTGVYTNFTMMPQFFKEIGYRTHMVGKWHLGFCHEEYIPNKRGFDTFYGYYTGSEDYYSHERTPDKGDKTPGYDFRDQDDPDRSAKGTYSSILLGDRAVKIIQDHAENHSDSPLFMYLPFQSVHSPLQVPKKYEDMYPNIKTKSRRIFSGMVSAMDEAVGKVVQELSNQGMLEDTVIVFTADNGGQVDAGGNNYPLRGNKRTMWEGGTRASAFIHSTLLKDNGTVNNELIHVVDWVPTLLSAVKNQLSIEDQVKVDEFLSEERDGIDQWAMLKGLEKGKRSEILYNIDPVFDKNGLNGAIRMGNWKLIKGDASDDGHDDHYLPDAYEAEIESNEASIEHGEMTVGNQNVLEPVIVDGKPIYLFDLSSDPNEYTNLADENPDIVDEMLTKFEEYQSSMIAPHIADEIEAGNPSHFDGAWGPGWCESEPGSEPLIEILLS